MQPEIGEVVNPTMGISLTKYSIRAIFFYYTNDVHIKEKSHLNKEGKMNKNLLSLIIVFAVMMCFFASGCTKMRVTANSFSAGFDPEYWESSITEDGDLKYLRLKEGAITTTVKISEVDKYTFYYYTQAGDFQTRDLISWYEDGIKVKIGDNSVTGGWPVCQDINEWEKCLQAMGEYSELIEYSEQFLVDGEKFKILESEKIVIKTITSIERGSKFAPKTIKETEFCLGYKVGGKIQKTHYID